MNYQVKYLGSVEVDYDPVDVSNNQEHAQKAMRALRAHHKSNHSKLSLSALSISVARIQLTAADGSKPAMRHSTTRIAYSTVDPEHPKLFAYVAVVKGTKLALCHVFSTKSAKQAYEMTFVCAQGFDMNYRKWSANREEALAAATASEKTDIEPTQAWQKKKPAGGGDAASAPLPADPVKPGEVAPGYMDVPTSGPDGVEDGDGAGYVDVKTSGDGGARRDSLFFAMMDGADPSDLAGRYFGTVGVELVESADADATAFEHMAAVREQPHQFGIGVDADQYNAAAADEGDVGYVTVGATVDFSAADEAGFDD